MAAHSARVAVSCGARRVALFPLRMPFATHHSTRLFRVGRNRNRVRVRGQVGAHARLAGVTVEHRGELLTGDARVRRRTIGYALVLCPVHALFIPNRAAICRFTCITRQYGHQHSAAHVPVRGERRGARAVHQLVFAHVLDRVREPAGLRNVTEAGNAARLCAAVLILTGRKAAAVRA